MRHEVCGLELTHLHTTEGSLLDGFGFVSEYAERWKSHGKYLCITDHGMMSAIPSQIRECKKNDLIPIYGCELYVNPLQIQYHSDKEFKDYQKTLDPDQLKLLRKSYHLLAIAHNEVGYSNLVTLSSLAWIHGFYYRPRINHELLMQYKEGITFTSCCYAGEIGQAFNKGGEDAGFVMIEKYMAMFGEHFYLEFMLLDFAKQRPYNQFVLKAKNKYGLPIIVTTDTHYCNKEDSHNQRLMLMVQTKNTIQDIQKKIEDAGAQDLFELQDTNLWQKTEDELNEKWEKDFQDIDYEIFKEAKRTTVEICRKAGGVKLDRSMKLPQLPDADNKLREAVFEGFKNRDLPQDKAYGYRLREEFELIFSKGFSSYFLILKATIDEARRYSMEVFGHPNAIGPGRGCLAPSVNIVMADGKFKKIKDIHADDKVVGRDGSINRVLGIFKYSVKEELLCIKSYYGDNNGVTLTKDHKILVEKLVRPINYDTWANSTKAARKNSIDPVGNLDWVSANNIAVGDWVFIPTPRLPEIPFDIFDLSVLTHDKTILTFDNDYVYQGKLNPLTKNVKPILKLSRYLTLNEDAYRVLGLFAGDGWIKSSGCEVGFAFNKNDKDGIDFLINFMDRIGISVKMVDHNIKELTQCKVYSRHFQLFIKHCFPNYKGTPHTKHVPYFLFNQNENRKQAFLKGYLFADGNVAEYKCSYSTVSENLASQVRFLCWQVGIPASLCFNNRIDKRDGRESVEIKINIPHHLAITESRDGQECFYRKIDNGLLMKVRSIEKVSGINEVYDLNIENQHNYLTTSFQVHNSDVGSLICYCLRITNVDPIQHDLLFSRFLSKARNDLPDADVDFLPQVRDYLKNDWAPSYFGRENVANIGSYNTFGIKSSLIDMVRVHGKDRNEILNLTTKLGLKDDDGNVLTWDKALEIYPELKKYCEDNPDIAASAKKLINRSRSMGKHAGGIIISSQPINKFVPLVRGKEGEIVSSWTEGLHDQDLGPMGFVKYDWLVITNLEQINYACKIIKERYGLTGICNKQGQEDWSDSSFINDPASITMANEADLKGIFQFDSDGIRHLVRKGGVNTFNDLVAYASLYRPGPMSEGMHDEYCDRKKGIKEFIVHDLLKPVLETTYGVIAYQEQCMRILHIVGDIPLEDCEILRKAISKKKEEYFAKYKVMFIQNGMKNLGWTEEEVVNLWKLLEAFAGYAFNMCLVGDTRVYDERGNLLLIKDVYNKFNNGEEICLQSLDVNGLMTVEKVTEVFDNGPQDVFVLKLSTGQRIKATAGHRFLTDEGWMALKDLSVGGWVATPNKIVCAELDFDIEDYKIICLAYFLSEGNTCHPSSLYFYNNDLNLVNDFVNNASLFGESNITVNQRTSGNYYVTINSGHKGDYRNYSKTNILEWVDNIGIRYKSARKKSLPSFIYSFSRPQISLLLAKMWEGDGHIGKTAYYATSSKTLAEQVQSLLLRLNITSTVGRKKFKYRGSYKIGFVVNLHGENWVRKFKDTIGEFIVSKKEILSSMLENSKNYDVIPYSFFKLIRDEIDISGMTSAKICDICGISVRLLNFDAHKKGFTRGIVKKIGIAINSVKLLKLATSDIYWSKVRSIRQAGKHDTYDITVNNTHSFVANDIISHNSHACAYTYISSMLLWLKSHYPLEFYTAILHFETDADKIKEYRLDAQRHDIVINPLDLNKSKGKFDITDNEIYFGFANVKGIGEVVAQKIIDNQPYSGFSDFLNRFGTDESVVKPLIGLRIFEKEGDQIKLYSYYKWFKDIREKREARKSRFEVSCNKDIEIAKELGFEITDHNDILKLTDSRDEVKKLVIKHDKLIKNYFKRETVDDKIPGLERFVILPDDKPIEIPEKLVALFASPEECEMQFYGFLWHHPICKSPDYEGKRTFDIYKEKGLQQGYVEVMINSVAKQTSKKNTSYWLIKAEDANGEAAQIQIWEDDWIRFKDDLKVGQYVKMEVKAPDKGFYRYTLYSPPKWLRTKLVPKTRAADMRVWVLRK